MTDNEIIQALECCFSENFDECKECPLKSKRDELFSCMPTKQKLALDLINRQKAEIERLKGFIEKDYGLILKLTGQPVNEYNKKIKCEAIKAFADRLKKTISVSGRQKDYFDNLVKEMAGDE